VCVFFFKFDVILVQINIGAEYSILIDSGAKICLTDGQVLVH
jgi:hypothetical protein